MRYKAFALLGMLVALLAVGTDEAGAQRRAYGPGRGGQPPEPPTRAQMEARVQEFVSTAMKNRLQLNDEQVAKLQATNQRLQGERMAMRAEELRVRSSLRAELMARDSMSEGRVDELLTRWMQSERRRVEFMESEQKALAEFLSPSQRARFMAMQDEIRRGVEEMREQRGGGAAPPRPLLRDRGGQGRAPRPPRPPMQ